MVMLRSEYVDLFDESMTQIFFNQFAQMPQVYQSVFNVTTSTKDAEKYSELFGIGLITEKNEYTDITYENMVQGYDVTMTNLSYARGIEASYEAVSDDLFRLIMRSPEALARSCASQIDTLASNVLNRAFATYTGGDGKVLCATDHPSSVGSQSNTFSTAKDFYQSSFKDAIAQIREQTDDQGLILGLRPTKLVGPAELEFDMNELLASQVRPALNVSDLLGASTSYQPPVSSTNYANRLGMEVVTWSSLTDADAWFVLSDVTGLYWQWREQPEFDAGVDKKNKNYWWNVFFRCVCNFIFWRGVFGTTGA